jgi:lipid-binding SYLF domain-containing protein
MPAKTTIEESAAATLKRLEEKDRGLKQMLKKAYAYAVFPAVGKASLVVGGSYGRGAVYERGKFIGHATISQLTVGVQIGGDTFSEVLVFENKEALDRLKKGKMAFAANASAVLVKAGAAGTKNFTNGVAAYAYSRGGMLLEAVIGGQKFSFKSADEEEQDEQDQDEGEEQQQGGRGAKGQRGEEGDEQDENEGGDGEGDGEESGLFGRAMGGVKSAASGLTETAKSHPIAATVLGTAIAAGAVMLIMRAVRGGGQESDEDQGQDEEGGARGEAEDEGEDQQDEGGGEEEEDDRSDTLNRLRRRRSRA